MINKYDDDNNKVYTYQNKASIVNYNIDEINDKILYHNIFLYHICKKLTYNHHHHNNNDKNIKWNFYIQCQDGYKFHIETYHQWKCIYYETDKKFIREIYEKHNIERIQSEYYIPYIDPIFFYLTQNHIRPDFDKKKDCLYEINKKRKWIETQSPKIYYNYIPTIKFIKKNNKNTETYLEKTKILFYPFPNIEILTSLLFKIKDNTNELPKEDKTFFTNNVEMMKNNGISLLSYILSKNEYLILFSYWYVFHYLDFLKQQITDFYNNKYFIYFQDTNDSCSHNNNNGHYSISQYLNFLFSQVNNLPQNVCGTESIILFQLAVQILKNI